MSYFQQFKNWLYSAFIEVLQKLESVVLSVFDMIKDFFLWSLDQLLGLAVTVLSAISMPLSWNPSQYISALPNEVTNMLGLIGLGECVSIITTAIIIRLGLQLIPFVRWGS